MRHTNTNSNTTQQQKELNYEWNGSGSARSGEGQNRPRERSGAEGFCFLAKLNSEVQKTGQQPNNNMKAQEEAIGAGLGHRWLSGVTIDAYKLELKEWGGCSLRRNRSLYHQHVHFSTDCLQLPSLPTIPTYFCVMRVSTLISTQIARS